MACLGFSHQGLRRPHAWLLLVVARCMSLDRCSNVIFIGTSCIWTVLKGSRFFFFLPLDILPKFLKQVDSWLDSASQPILRAYVVCQPLGQAGGNPDVGGNRSGPQGQDSAEK